MDNFESINSREIHSWLGQLGGSPKYGEFYLQELNQLPPASSPGEGKRDHSKTHQSILFLTELLPSGETS